MIKSKIDILKDDNSIPYHILYTQPAFFFYRHSVDSFAAMMSWI